MAYKTLEIPRFPEMTLRDAIALGTRRLEEDGYVGVRFDPTSAAENPPTGNADWKLGFRVAEPAEAATG